MLFSERLRNCRVAAGLTQKEASEAVGVKIRQWQDYEAGKKTPTFDRLLFIADFFGISIDYLVGKTDYPEMVDVVGKSDNSERYKENGHDKEEFSNRLYFLRMDRGIKAAKLAAVLGIPVATMRKLENGLIKPSEEILSKFADYFNVTTDYMSGETTDILVDGRQAMQIDGVEMSVDVRDSSLNMLEKFMYIILHTFIASGTECPSLNELQDACSSSSTNTVLRILKSLEKKQIITRAANFDDSTNGKTKKCYIVNDIPKFFMRRKTERAR